MKIVINEKQEKLIYNTILNEAMSDKFSFEELQTINTFRGRYNYCLSTLGPTQGKGSSRVIFQLSDGKVLKLALNNKGIAQNEVECDWGLQSYNIVPKLYDETDTTNYYYLVSEYVLPAKKQDFKHVFNFTFETFCRCLVSIENWYNPNARHYISPMDDASLEILLNDSDELSPFYNYITNYQPPIGDMLRISNYGMTNRNGKPQIVLLDSGLNNNVYNSYYK
jgi:hypothetical protein